MAYNVHDSEALPALIINLSKLRRIAEAIMDRRTIGLKPTDFSEA